MSPSADFKLLLESLHTGLIATDAGGGVQYINKAACNILNMRDATRINGISFLEILPAAAGIYWKALQDNLVCKGQYVAQDRRKLVMGIAPVENNGKIVGAIASVDDLQDFEEALCHSDEYLKISRQLKAIFKGSSDGLWVHDNQGRIININTVSEMINGIRAKDVIGKSIYDLIEAGIFEGAVTPEILRTKRQFSTLSYNKKTGKKVLVTGTPILDEHGEVSLIVSNERDLTHWNAVKADLERSRRVAQKYKDEYEELSRIGSTQPEIVAESKEMKHVLRTGMKLARMGASNILIQGESGTGKGLLAKFIHENGRRHSKPFIQINCAALPEGLLEAELFGYEKGAFTGARERGKIGLFELAHEGTLFLDEIGDLPLSVQAKLLKYLDDQEILPLGGIQRKKVDCSIIAATNQDLEQLTRQGRFRQDLFFRLNTFMIYIPPLRHRTADIVKMTGHFLKVYNTEFRVRRHISPETMLNLQAYAFPGNVRELQNIIKNAVVLSETDNLDDMFPGKIDPVPSRRAGSGKFAPAVEYPMRLRSRIDELEKEILADAFTRFKSTRQMALNLGTSQSSIMRKLKKHNIGP